jgi:hypothetical protein
MQKWTYAQRAFAIKAYYKNGYSFVKVQHLFEHHFEIHLNDPVPSAYTVQQQYS